MTYFADLSPYRYMKDGFRPGSICIGWLDQAIEFSKGDTPPEFLDKLRNFYAVRFVQTRGLHRCHFCDRHPLYFEQTDTYIGSAELRIFGGANRVYCAPDLLIHYIEAHNYLPPQEFVSAVLHAPDPNSDEYIDNCAKLDLFPYRVRGLSTITCYFPQY